MRRGAAPTILTAMHRPSERIAGARGATRRLPAATSLLLPMLLSVGCGHPATKAECEEIFARSAEIELRSLNVTDTEEIRRRTEEAREARGEALLEQCIGRRITDRAMRCVRGAQTREELDACLM